MWSGSLWVSGWVRAVWLALSAWIFIKLSAQLLAKSFCESKGSLGIRGVPATINWAEGRRCKVSGNAQPSGGYLWGPAWDHAHECTWETCQKGWVKRWGGLLAALSGQKGEKEARLETGRDPAWLWASKVKYNAGEYNLHLAGRTILSSGWVVGSKLTFSIQG